MVVVYGIQQKKHHSWYQLFWWWKTSLDRTVNERDTSKACVTFANDNETWHLLNIVSEERGGWSHLHCRYGHAVCSYKTHITNGINVRLLSVLIRDHHRYMRYHFLPLQFAPKPKPKWQNSIIHICSSTGNVVNVYRRKDLTATGSVTVSVQFHFAHCCVILILARLLSMFTNRFRKQLDQADALLQLCNNDVGIKYANISIATENITENIRMVISKTNNSSFVISNASCYLCISSQVAPSLRKSMFFCRSGFNEQNCTSIMQETVTGDGLCFTYNMLNSRDILRKGYTLNVAIFSIFAKYSNSWKLLYKYRISSDFLAPPIFEQKPQWTPDDGFNRTISAHNFTHPYRVYRAGERHEWLAVIRLFDEDLNQQCRSPFDGYKLILHAPHEYPNSNRHFQNIRLPLAKHLTIAIIPHVVSTSAGLRNYQPENRQCYYSSERRLRYYQYYSQSNCEMECLANLTLAHCGCVKFSSPRTFRQTIKFSIEYWIRPICQASTYIVNYFQVMIYLQFVALNRLSATIWLWLKWLYQMILIGMDTVNACLHVHRYPTRPKHSCIFSTLKKCSKHSASPSTIYRMRAGKLLQAKLHSHRQNYYCFFFFNLQHTNSITSVCILFEEFIHWNTTHRGFLDERIFGQLWRTSRTLHWCFYFEFGGDRLFLHNSYLVQDAITATSDECRASAIARIDCH